MTAAKPDTKQGKKLTAVWIIPIVAAVLGAWMVVYTYMTEGPEIRVTFNTASGLEESKTVVKFRNVEMGQVQEVLLSEDMQNVTAVIKMRREALPLLVEDTRFWIVTAQIGGGGISGLDTLLSGAYIQISPGESRSKSLDFVGLEAPPLTPVGANGVRLVLHAERTSSVSSGDPVLYHGYKVGRVESLTFDPEQKRIRYLIFIDAPYDILVTTSSRFWDVSGISLKAGAEGIEVSTGSLESVLIGGVTFGTPPAFDPGVAVEDNTEFRLFPNYGEILESPHEQRAYYVVRVEQSIKGLLPGAPVEYRGIKIGEVERDMMAELITQAVHEDEKPQGGPIPVLIYLEPARLTLPDNEESLKFLQRIIDQGTTTGLRATVGAGSLLTGAKIIELDYYDDLPQQGLGEFEGYAEIPTIVTGLSGIEDKISKLLDKVNELPIEATMGTINVAVVELNLSLKALHEILDNQDLRTIPGELQNTLEALRTILEDEDIREIPGEIQNTLAAARFQLQGESPEIYQLGKTLKEVEAAARALREFLDAIEKKPEALIRGKSDTAQ